MDIDQKSNLVELSK